MSNLARTVSSDERDSVEFVANANVTEANVRNPAGTTAPFQEIAEASNRQIHAASARMAGRYNAAQVPDDEVKAYQRDRQKLLDKMFANTITREEKNQLTYIRWTLDRIEDARYGFTLDLLESQVEQYERLAADIHLLQAQLRQHSPKHSSKRRK